MRVTYHAISRAIERYPKKFSKCEGGYGKKRKLAEMWAKYSFLKEIATDGSRFRIGNGIKFVEREGVIITAI